MTTIAARPLPAAEPVAERPSFRAVALPVEHGGWGFLLEPLVLGLAVAPSMRATALAASAIAAFLARHPLKLALADRRRGRRYPRTRWAEAFAAAYAALAFAFFALGAAGAPWSFWSILSAAAVPAIVQLGLDVAGRGRTLVAEISGSAALASTAAAVAVLGGWRAAPALGLWGIVAARAVVSVVYVRARLRLDRATGIDTRPVWACHAVAFLGAGALAAAGCAPWSALVAFGALFARAVAGLSARRAPLRPQAVGFREMGFGVLTVVLVAVGYVWRF